MLMIVISDLRWKQAHEGSAYPLASRKKACVYVCMMYVIEIQIKVKNEFDYKRSKRS